MNKPNPSRSALVETHMAERNAIIQSLVFPLLVLPVCLALYSGAYFTLSRYTCMQREFDFGWEVDFFRPLITVEEYFGKQKLLIIVRYPHRGVVM